MYCILTFKKVFIMSKKNDKNIDKNLSPSQRIQSQFQEFVLKNYSDGDKIPTCSSRLNDLLCGGLPRGIVVELYGHEGSGKSSLMLSTISYLLHAEEYKDYMFCYIDTEGGLCSSTFKTRYNIDSERVVILSVSNGEKVFDIIDSLTQEKSCLLIVLDSVATLITNEDLEAENSLGSHSRMMSRRLRRTIGLMNQSKTNTTLVLVNQLRSKIGMGDSWKGEFQYTTTGGKSIKYYSSLRIEIDRNQFIVEKDRRIGFMMNVKIHKSRFSVPYETCLIPVLFEYAISYSMELVDILFEKKYLVKGSPASYIIWDNVDEPLFEIKQKTRYELFLNIKDNVEHINKIKKLLDIK